MKRRSGATGAASQARGRKTAKLKRRKLPNQVARPGSLPAGREAALAQLRREVNEAREQQTAASEVLQVISRSSGELQPVFDTMLANAVRLCEAKFGMLWLTEGDGLRAVALHGVPAAFATERRGERIFQFDQELPIGRLVATKRLVHVADVTTEAAYIKGKRELRELADLGGARSLLLVPMLNGSALVGTITIYRQEVRAFTDKQIELVKNFAAQAVIAIENARLLNELRQSLQQQTATSEVLQVISRSPGELEPVFATMLENAVRICGAGFGMLFLSEGDAFRAVAQYGAPPAWAEARRREPVIRPSAKNPLARVAAKKQLEHITDIRTDEGYVSGDPAFLALAEIAEARTLLVVPMIKEDGLVGIISIYRQEVRPFTEKQIALVQNFAAQAVIAIENARLLNELRQRTTDLTEALEQQTATSEILQVISSSPGFLEPVFASMLENAVRICDANFGNIYRWDGDALHLVATHQTPPAFADARRYSLSNRPGPKTVTARMLATKEVVHVVDAAAEPGYGDKSDENAVAAVDLGGVRTILAVPMWKENVLIGSFTVYRREVRLFTDEQIELVKNFAAQAVIAIENARLLNELRESLEQQTATAEVLRVINSSPGNLSPVFDAILEKAHSLCGAAQGTMFLYDGDYFRAVAQRGMPDALVGRFRQGVHGRDVPVSSRLIAGEPFVHIADLAEVDNPVARAAAQLAGTRTLLSVPLRKDEALLGMIVAARREERLFSANEIALLQNFAAQAVIAIENARLLNELRQRTTDLTEALGQQTATADVLKVISRSQFDLQLVLDTLVTTAASLCGAKRGTVFRRDGDLYRGAAFYNASPELVDFIRRYPISEGRHTITARVALERRVIHVADLQEDPEYTYALRDIEPARTILGVPMFRGDDLLGVFILYKLKVEPFTDKQIELVTTFADQAVIAIENTRLLRELHEQTEEVVKLNQQLERRVADQVGEIERMGRLRRFLPPQVADLIVASGNEKQLESHRREITALFCDLRGFTGFTETADAEDVITLLREYHAAVGEKIIKYSGTLERYAGDGVMVVFNDPVPVENPALQAVLMALEMRGAIGALTETWRRWGHDIGFGIGIAHGFATLGTIGFEGRFDYAAIGTVSNVASRLCDEAKPGQILISPRVLTKVENAVTVEPVGEFALKGIRRPLAAYNVLAANAAT